MIHLVNMPFASLIRPSLPLGLFKAQLAEAGMRSEVFNLNFDFAHRIGVGGYEAIALFKGIEAQVGEWLFARAAWRCDFGRDPTSFLNACSEELENIPKIPDRAAWLQRIREEVVDEYLDACVAELEDAGPLRVVGFSCTFFQTVPSLALGRRIKERHPETKLVYGGSCLHGPMGDEIMRNVSWIDAMSIGEADHVIVPLVAALAAGRNPTGLQGVLYRDEAGAVRCERPHSPAPEEVIVGLPDPDYDSFFAEAARYGLDQSDDWRERLLLPFESSRGCWWGQKRHCSFCGLNGEGMAYRKKPGADVYRMLRRLAGRYPLASRFQASDNILSPTYFKDLIPQLKEEPLEVELFYSVKANLTRRQLRALAEAGIWYIQPGIESLSSDVLRLMNKGVTALQNVFLLKACREYGIIVYWNNLIRLPGESAASYAQMAEWIPRIPHLRPPYGGAPMIECHRFSPYHDQASQWTSAIRPQPWYSDLFPSEVFDLDRLAYYFEADWKGTLKGSPYQQMVDATMEWVRVWREEPELPQLRIHPRSDGGIDIEDTRNSGRGTWRLDAFEAGVYTAIDVPTPLGRITRVMADSGAARGTKAAVRAVLDEFEGAGLALREGDRYLAIALAEGTLEPPLEIRRGRQKPKIRQQRKHDRPPAEARG